MTGSGTAVDPYIISDVDDLQAIESDLAAYYELGGNIDASATSGWNGNEGFVPIGAGSPYFTGQLDGKGYTISSLYINRASISGLFKYVTSSAVFQNIKMTDVDITGKTNCAALICAIFIASGITVTGCSSTGSIVVNLGSGVVGFDSGGLIGVANGSPTITNCWSSCSVTQDKDRCGGLIGWVSGTPAISKCYATGALSAEDYAGGLIGRMDGGTVDDCYATGAVTTSAGYAGGFIGDNRVALDDCYSVGAVSAGNNPGGFCAVNTGSITNCFWDTTTSGQAASDGGTGKTTSQMKTQSTFTGAGWNFSTIWGMSAGQNNGYPYLSAGISTDSTAFEISIVQTQFHYVDAYGTERFIEGTPVV